jgi:hypothetical protein
MTRERGRIFMTRKDYIVLADAIATVAKKDLTDTITLQDLVNEISNALARDNYRFDYSRFASYINKQIKA